MSWFALSLLGIVSAALLTLAIVGIRERVPRVVLMALGLLVVVIGAGIGLHAVQKTLVGVWISTGLVLAVLGLAGASLLTWGRLPDSADTSSAERYDERDHMFSRANLVGHPDLARAHHANRPEHREVDERVWALPALGGSGSRYHDPAVAPVADAAFSVLERSYRPLAERSIAPRSEVGLAELAATIRLIATKYGAADIGFARTLPHHWYRVAGRQARRWGAPVEPRHGTAIIIVIAMDFHAIQKAPTLPVLLESSRQYVTAAVIAHVIAEYLSSQGHEATAHVDGNYEVICAPLAQDAGLGHVGRLGIFMHRRLGPCVRLSVVTTDLELPVTRGDHRYMEAFCEICRKCAESCPSRSIPTGGRPTSRGFSHWSIDQESCYTFWRRIGTDCAMCIRSCPFTKPDTALHRVVRWFIRRNPMNRRLALLADDLFYGRRPRIDPQNPSFEELTRVG